MSFFVYHFCLISISASVSDRAPKYSYLRLRQVGIFELLKANNFKITLEGLQISHITKFQKQFMIWSELLSFMKTDNV